MQELRSTFTWHCAKSSRPINGDIVHLYLPHGQRIEGYGDGSNVFFVSHGIDVDGAKMEQAATARCAWMRGALVNETSISAMSHCKNPTLKTMGVLMRSYAVDLFRVVGNQMVEDNECRKKMEMNNEIRQQIINATKLVLDREFDPDDRYETLRPSFQSLLSAMRPRRTAF